MSMTRRRSGRDDAAEVFPALSIRFGRNCAGQLASFVAIPAQPLKS